MDNLTHTLVGIALSRGFFKGRVAYATSASVIAANLPDVDVAYSWPGLRTIEYHRGVLHSLWMLPVWALLVAWGLRWFVRRRQPGMNVPAFWSAFCLGAAGVGSHILLDWTNAYGIRLWAPASQHWYALDLMPIWDPWVWLFLGAFLAFPMLLALIGSEVGSKRRHTYRRSGLAALILLMAWVGLRARQHAAALEGLNSPEAATYFEGDEPLNWAALPVSSDPWHWQAVVDLPARLLIGRISVPWDRGPGSMELLRSYTKPPLAPAIAVAEQTHTARVFLNFARFPLADVETQGSRFAATITDLRFADGVQRPTMHVTVSLDAGLRVLHQQFSWRR